MILLILKKDLKLFFSNKKNVLLTFLIPILLISLFSFAFGGIGNSSISKKHIELLYIDNDSSTISKQLISQLNSLGEIKMISSSIIDGEKLVRKGKKAGFLVIKKGFQDSVSLAKELPVILKYDASEPFKYNILQSIITGKLRNTIGKSIYKNKIKNYFNTKFKDVPSNLKNNIIDDISTQIELSKNTSFTLKTISIIKKQTKKGNLGLIQAVAGTAIMMLLFSITGVGGGLLEEKESGTLARLLYSPLKATDILFGKMGATLLISIFQLIVMFVFAWLAFGLPIFKDTLTLLFLTLSVAFSVSSFGIFLVSIAKTRQQLQNLSTIIILVMSAIGGSMIPLFVMPSIMQKMAVISLNYWGIQGYYDIFWRELSFLEILPRIAVLCVIGLIMTAISIPLFKKNITTFTN